MQGALGVLRKACRAQFFQANPHLDALRCFSSIRVFESSLDAGEQHSSIGRTRLIMVKF